MQFENVFLEHLRETPDQGDLWWRRLFPAQHEPETRARYLKAADAATFTNLSKTFLARARRDGSGPPFIKAGKKVLYDLKDLIRWMNAQKRTQTRSATMSKRDRRPSAKGAAVSTVSATGVIATDRRPEVSHHQGRTGLGGPAR